MALTKTMQVDVNGSVQTVADAYIKVSRINGSKKLINATIDICESKGAEPVTKMAHGFVPVLNDVNFIAQAYEHLKTLPEFEGATDC